jgi:histidinol-phosphate aminotransferase
MFRDRLADVGPNVPERRGHVAARLDANESPYGLSPLGRRLLAEALAGVETNRYPDPRATRIRDLIARREGVDPRQIVIGNGSDEVIALLAAALASPPRGQARAASLAPVPSFAMYRFSSIAAGIEPMGVALDDQWDLDVSAMIRALDTYRPNLIFLPSPNNPTGNLFSADRIDALVAAARGRALVILDEAYGAYARQSYRQLREENDHVGQLQTLSKVGLAGVRVGWAILPPKIADIVDKVRTPYNLNALSQRAAELVFGDLAPELAAAVEQTIAERTRLAARLAAFPWIRVWPSEANFLWIELDRDAGEVQGALARRGLFVRALPARAGQPPRHLRITVGTPAEDDCLVGALAEITKPS